MPTKCYYCNKSSEYTQPEITTGNIIDVCSTHFTYMYAG